jgi:hypothetical protein
MAFARIIEISLSSVALLPRERIVAITCDRMAFVKTSAIWPAIVSLHLENVNNLSARVTEGGFLPCDIGSARQRKQRLVWWVDRLAWFRNK